MPDLSVNLTHAAWNTLARCLMEPRPNLPFQKMITANKVWGRIRKAFPFVVDGHDLDDQFQRKPGETTDDFAVRAERFTAAMKLWLLETDCIYLSNKQLEAAREAVRYCNEHADKCSIKLVHDNHTASLLIAIGLADDETDA